MINLGDVEELLKAIYICWTVLEKAGAKIM